MIVVSAFPLVSARAVPSIARLIPLVMMMCLPPAVAKSSSTISSLLRRSGFESGFAFVGQAWTNDEAVGAFFCRRVLFRALACDGDMLTAHC